MEISKHIWLDHWPQFQRHAHKYDRGHLFVFGGPMASSGAARLAARAGLRMGAGLVTTAFPASALPTYAAHQTAVMNAPLKDDTDVLALLKARKATALVIGPGYGLGEQTKARVMELLSTALPMVLDADALTSFEHEPAALFSALHDAAVLTPHEGEFARLFPDLDLYADKAAAAIAAAKRAGCVMCLKGADTHIAAPDGRHTVSQNGPPWLATAGAGDVLAGMIAGLLAQGMPAFEATLAANHLHGEAAKLFGAGMIAEDLVEAIPKVLPALKS